MTPHWRKQLKWKITALLSWSSEILIAQVISGIWWLQWYSRKQIPIMSSFINSFLFLLPSSVPQNQKQAKPKVISDTHLPGRRAIFSNTNSQPVLCKMELLNNLISMAAPWNYNNTAVWWGMHKNTHTLIHTRGDQYTFLSSTKAKRWMLKVSLWKLALRVFFLHTVHREAHGIHSHKALERLVNVA